MGGTKRIRDAKAQLTRRGREWFERVRLRAALWVVGVACAAVAMISLTAVPVWPVVGVAFAVVAVAVNKVAGRLQPDQLRCYGCGKDLSGQVAGAYGVVCDACGKINQRYIVDPAERHDTPPQTPASTPASTRSA
ncbi:MAG: hypothetical protein HRU70_14225 [Phycisphaeraceae bacterium]|nr:MAG: hypothetical protein HRU70_14225 [Phycisphaeraceae bacterium]